jgi:hypothetical protein
MIFAGSITLEAINNRLLRVRVTLDESKLPGILVFGIETALAFVLD